MRRTVLDDFVVGFPPGGGAGGGDDGDPGTTANGEGADGRGFGSRFTTGGSTRIAVTSSGG